MNESDNWSKAGEAQEIVQRLSPESRNLFLAFEMERRTRYRERWQALEAFEKHMHWYAADYTAFVQRLQGRRTEPVEPRADTPEARAYTEIQQVKDVLAFERVKARQDPIEDTPVGPFQDPQDGDDPAPSPIHPPATEAAVAQSEGVQEGDRPRVRIRAGSEGRAPAYADYEDGIRWSAARVTKEYDSDGYTGRDQLRVDAWDWCKQHGVRYGKHDDWYRVLINTFPDLLRPDGKRRPRR
jgi:hypothetical protein